MVKLPRQRKTQKRPVAAIWRSPQRQRSTIGLLVAVCKPPTLFQNPFRPRSLSSFLMARCVGDTRNYWDFFSLPLLFIAFVLLLFSIRFQLSCSSFFIFQSSFPFMPFRAISFHSLLISSSLHSSGPDYNSLWFTYCNQRFGPRPLFCAYNLA